MPFMSFSNYSLFKRNLYRSTLSWSHSGNGVEEHHSPNGASRNSIFDSRHKPRHKSYPVLTSPINRASVEKIVLSCSKNTESFSNTRFQHLSVGGKFNPTSFKPEEKLSFVSSRYCGSKHHIFPTLLRVAKQRFRNHFRGRCGRTSRQHHESSSQKISPATGRFGKNEKDFLKAYLKKFDTEEVEVLRQVYIELSARNPGAGIDKETFLEYFRLPGLWGERLFHRFDYKCLGFIDYEEFLVGIAVCCRGTKYERINVLFQVFDLNDDGLLQKGELVAMLSNLPDLDRYVRKQPLKNDRQQPHFLCSTNQIVADPCLSNLSFCHVPTYDQETRNEKDDIQPFGDSVDSPRFLGNVCFSAAPEELDEEDEEDDDEDDDDDEEEEEEEEKQSDGCFEKPFCAVPFRSLSNIHQEKNTDGWSTSELNNLSTTMSKIHSNHLNFDSEAVSLMMKRKKAKLLRLQPKKLDSSKDIQPVCLYSSYRFGDPLGEPSRCQGESFMATSTSADRAIDVEAFVDEIIEECEFSEADTLTFIEFKTWMEQNDVILAMFTECLHEEVWGLQGNALYRRSGFPDLHTERSSDEKSKNATASQFYNNTSHDVKCRCSRGVIELRPDNFYKIGKLFTVSVRCTLSTLLEGQDQKKHQGNVKSKNDCIGSSTSICSLKSISTYANPKGLSVPSCSTLSSFQCPLLFSLNKTEASGFPPPSDQLRSRGTREILDVQMLELIKAANPQVEVSKLKETLDMGKSDEKICLFTCPSCHLLLVVCPRCKRTVSSLQLFHGTVVVECENCLEGLPYQFYNCWHCRWNFSKAADMIDQCEPIYEGFLYKIGRHTYNLKERYFVLIDNLLYYYRRKEDTKPLGFFFLEGCFVNAVEEKKDSRHHTEYTSQLTSTSLTGQPHDSAEKARRSFGTERDTWLMILRSHFVVKVNHFVSLLRNKTRSSTFHNKFGFSITHGLGKIPSRIFYTDSREQREEWLRALKLAVNQQSVEDFYQIDKLVGQGKFSVVYHAVTRDPRRKMEEVAIKVIEKHKMSLHEHELLRSELSVLRLLRHPHVIHLRQIFSSPTHIYIVMEYVKGGELYDLLEKKKRVLSESHVNHIIFQLLSTIAYLHKCGIIHRDIKPENILLTDDSNEANVKITDFGLSCICGPSEFVTQPCGTLAYVAPEVLTLQGYNHKVDVWSVGIVMYLLLCGRLPFPVTSLKHHPALLPKPLAKPSSPPSPPPPPPLSQVTEQTNALPKFSEEPPFQVSQTYTDALSFSARVWDQVSSSAKDLLRKLLHPNPAKRISAPEALEHIWIKNPTAVITEATSHIDLLDTNLCQDDIESSEDSAAVLKKSSYHSVEIMETNVTHIKSFQHHDVSFTISDHQEPKKIENPNSFLTRVTRSLPVMKSTPSQNSPVMIYESNQSQIHSPVSLPLETSSSTAIPKVSFTSLKPSAQLSKKRFLDVTASSFSTVPLASPVL